jgi:hypothetical protein
VYHIEWQAIYEVRNITFEEGLLHRTQIQGINPDAEVDANFSNRQAPGTENGSIDINGLFGNPIDSAAENASEAASADYDDRVNPPPPSPDLLNPVADPPVPAAVSIDPAQGHAPAIIV